MGQLALVRIRYVKNYCEMAKRSRASDGSSLGDVPVVRELFNELRERFEERYVKPDGRAAMGRFETEWERLKINRSFPSQETIRKFRKKDYYKTKRNLLNCFCVVPD